jgi:hypothetical protein
VDDLWTAACEPAGTKPKEVPMATSLTADLREAYRRAACALSAEQLELVARARDTLNVPLAERNQLLVQIVAAYRAGPRQLWGAVLLDLAAPALLEVIQRFEAPRPVVDEQDLSQQLVLQFLHAAATMQVRRDGRGLKRKLVSRAAKALARHLFRESHHQSWHCSFEANEEDAD